MKFIYRVLILLGVFVGSLIFFSQNMKKSIFDIEKKEMEMSDAALPYISLRVNETELNLLHGYGSNLDGMLLRETITPITSEQSFEVMITENESIVKKVTYEITDIATMQEVENGSVIALDKEGEIKTARIRLKENLIPDTEYAAKITLITNQSRRIYFYTRLKVIDNSYLKEKLEFVQNFHQSTFDKEKVSDIKKYLETKGNADNSTFAKVNIHSSLDMISWKDIKPVILYKELPKITEFSKDTASVVLAYDAYINTMSGTEYYHVKEHYRFRYTENRVYLYDFERVMEEWFDPTMISLSKSEFKLGITNQTELEIIPNKSNNMFAFVRQRELWLYTAADNQIIRVFSFRQKNTDYIRDVFEQHNVRILNMDNDGNIDFIVYGYMNRGEYEGRVGIVLYHYDRILGRIEEQIYIPVNTTYQILEEELSDFTYQSTKNIFYFCMFETIYAYNFTSRSLTIIAEQIQEEQLVFSAAGEYVAWQESSERSERIWVLMLETGERKTIEAGSGEYICILGNIDENIIYGLVRKADISIDNLGNPLYPMYTVKISDKDGLVLKNYQEEGYYTQSVFIEDNVITLNRLTDSSSAFSKYKQAEDDYIMNRSGIGDSNYTVTKRVTDLMLTEYYISLPSYYEIKEMPTLVTTKNTVILEDTTVRVTKTDSYQNRYFAYSFGELVVCSTKAGEVIRAADEAVGTVIDSYGRLIWQRGGKSTKAEVTGITPVYLYGGMDSIQACLKMIFQLKSIEVDTANMTREEKSIENWMRANMKAEPINLSNATLDEVLYMISKGKPVLAMKGENSAVLITAYDSVSITYIDPAAGRSIKSGLKEAEELFTQAGSLYISYVE